MTPAGTRLSQRQECTPARLRALGGALLLLLAFATPAFAESAPSILLTSGVVKAVDHAQGVVVLGSGWTLRVRSVIVDGQLRDMSAVRVDDVVFVSGAILESPAPLQSAGQRTNR